MLNAMSIRAYGNSLYHLYMLQINANAFTDMHCGYAIRISVYGNVHLDDYADDKSCACADRVFRHEKAENSLDISSRIKVTKGEILCSRRGNRGDRPYGDRTDRVDRRGYHV